MLQGYLMLPNDRNYFYWQIFFWKVWLLSLLHRNIDGSFPGLVAVERTVPHLVLVFHLSQLETSHKSQVPVFLTLIFVFYGGCLFVWLQVRQCWRFSTLCSNTWGWAWTSSWARAQGGTPAPAFPPVAAKRAKSGSSRTPSSRPSVWRTVTSCPLPWRIGPDSV